VIDSVLIANRGEVAVRVIRACRQLGIRAVALHDEVDTGAFHVRMADEAWALPPSRSSSPYLDVEAVVEVAVRAGVEAVHPGYGFLSESAELASAVEASGRIFVGPPPEVIAAMGDKTRARSMAISAGVPVLPGTSQALADDEDPFARADEIGFPLAVKASFGGGGRGLRIVQRRSDLLNALGAARREARAAFGRAEIFFERYLDQARHVEVQILGGADGQVIHLGDRDCSIQRRHQKLIEEAPAPKLAPDVRLALRQAGVDVARAVGYVGVGTVEFLLDREGHDFWFLEMNTRLQVEHGVTELVTGVDLVVAQFMVASGDGLGLSQDDVVIRGHAVEARVVAEDPFAGFVPCAGRIGSLRLPQGPWVRADLGVESGDEIPSSFDPTFGKLLAWAPDRDTAISRLGMAIDEFAAPGVVTVLPYLRGILRQPAFLEVRHSTASLEGEWAPTLTNRDVDAGAASTPRSAAAARSTEAGGVRRVAIATSFGVLDLEVPGRRAAGRLPDDLIASTERDGATGEFLPVIGPSEADTAAPMDAVVVAVAVGLGATVLEGDVLVVLEAMKMEFEIKAPGNGSVVAVHVTTGDFVRVGARLVDVAAAPVA
jgi:acetyl-CoA/propionyl-CoA carboxylase biotin carboxyl carrier protein